MVSMGRASFVPSAPARDVFDTRTAGRAYTDAMRVRAARDRARSVATLALFAAVALGSASARAADVGDSTGVTTASGAEPRLKSLTRRYWQVGVAFNAEVVAFAGPICNQQPCILGSGGGIAARAGIRTVGPYYLGLAYEFTKHDASQIYRLAVLQQLRFEGRYYFLDVRRDTQPYLLGGLGGAAYGNEWTVDTGGPAATLGIGTETQISTTTVFGVALAYRTFYSAAFFDGARRHDDGFVQMVGLELLLEGRDPF